MSVCRIQPSFRCRYGLRRGFLAQITSQLPVDRFFHLCSCQLAGVCRIPFPYWQNPNIVTPPCRADALLVKAWTADASARLVQTSLRDGTSSSLWQCINHMSLRLPMAQYLGEYIFSGSSSASAAAGSALTLFPRPGRCLTWQSFSG